MTTGRSSRSNARRSGARRAAGVQSTAAGYGPLVAPCRRDDGHPDAGMTIAFLPLVRPAGTGETGVPSKS
jgi:hypothetical protein